MSLFCFSKKKKGGEYREREMLLVLSHFFLWEQVLVLEDEGFYIF